MSGVPPLAFTADANTSSQDVSRALVDEQARFRRHEFSRDRIAYPKVEVK